MLVISGSARLLSTKPGQAQHEPGERAHYQSLRSHGKTARVAHVACARKLLIFANAALRDLSAGPS